jgi:multidrug efflux pump subunit AcrB
MNFVTWAIRNPVPVFMLFVILTFGGLVAFKGLGIQEMPDIAFPTVTVSMSYSGTPPEQLEAEITRKIEDAVANVVGVRHVSSQVSQGLSTTILELQVGTDLSQAVDDVRDAVTRVRPNLPADALEPVISRITLAGVPVLTYSVASPGMSDEELSWFVDQVVTRRLSTVAGVGRVSRIGGVEREVRVDLDPDRMSALGATASDVSRQLKRIQADLPAGTARVGGQEQNVRALGTIQDVRELAALPIVLSDNRTVRLDTIATVNDQAAERRQLALLDGKAVVGFSVSRAWGASIAGVAEGVEKQVAALRTSYPNMRVAIINDESVTRVRESYHDSMMMLYEGAGLAILVVWLFLRNWRATIISASALPLAVIPTFLGMALFGYTLNMLTLLALTLVIGMLVDDAIVEVENIVRHQAMGKPPLEAAKDAAIEIGLAVVATSLTLVAVFVPVAFMKGITGEFFRPFAFTAALAVLCSLLVARMMTPALAAHWMKPQDLPESEPRMLHAYLRAINWCLRHRRITLGAATAVLVGTLSLGPLLSSSFTPGGDRGDSNLVVELPPGSTLEQTRAASETLRQRIAAFPETARIFNTIGNGSSVRTANLDIIWKPRDQRKRPSLELQRLAIASGADIPGTRVSSQAALGTGNGISFSLVGENSASLATAAAAVTAEMNAAGGFSGVNSSASLLEPEIVVRPIAERAAELGVTTDGLSTAVRFATSGDVDLGLAKMNLPNRQVPIRVRLADSARNDISQLRLIPVPGRGGAVPLANVADISYGTAVASISRYDHARSVAISADLVGQQLGDALVRIGKLPAMQHLPAGVRRLDTGASQFLGELVSGFLLAMAIGILCIYALLVLLFHDFIQPITILSALPPSLGGAFLFLLIFGFDLSLPSLIGMLTLMGIVTKNSILVVEYVVMARRDHGLSRHDAIIDACSKRARPIIMTTIAMGAGMLPIAMGWSGDSSFRSPMGVAVIGGLLASTLLSLFVVPSVYTVMDDWQEWLRRKFGGRQRPGADGLPAVTIGIPALPAPATD